MANMKIMTFYFSCWITNTSLCFLGKSVAFNKKDLIYSLYESVETWAEGWSSLNVQCDDRESLSLQSPSPFPLYVFYDIGESVM